MLKFTTVTWYSQLLAILLAVSIFMLGIFVGIEVQKRENPLPVSEPAEELDQATGSEILPSPATTSRTVTGFRWLLNATDQGTDYPNTNVSLITTLSDGTDEVIEIGTVDGQCNAMPVETELALNSEQLLCYYAGFGYQFRVVTREGSFVVEQKEIEEAGPEYNPPLTEFVAIHEISSGGEVKSVR